MSDDLSFLTAIPWFGWVAIVAIVCGCISGIVQMKFRHRERIEMIRQGMNPDAGPDAKPAGHREL
jgi:hypothetical protein